MNYIDLLLADVLTTSKTAQLAFTNFDKVALSPVKGKFMAFGIILGIFLLAMIFAGVISRAASAILTPASAGLRTLMEHIEVHPLFVSLICDVLVNVLYFALMMASFVLGITLGFNLMEETGYLARISFLFDHTMSKVGLQGKTIMPFFMGLGCTIAGTTGTRVVDNWGQRVLAIAMSWAVPCAATLSVVPTIAIALFGSNGGFFVILSIFLFMFLMMWAVYKIFGVLCVRHLKRIPARRTEHLIRCGWKSYPLHLWSQSRRKCHRYFTDLIREFYQSRRTCFYLCDQF